MRKVKNKKVNVRKQLKVKLENTATKYKNTVGFKPTQKQAYQWFRYINRCLFNSRLPMVEIQVKSYTRIGADVLPIGTTGKHLRESLINV